MATGRGQQHSVVDDFTATYRRLSTRVMLAVEREVFGANIGSNGYTTIAQAKALAVHLGLRPGMRLLDVGSGRGWPGLYLAKRSGCDAVITDLPEPALRSALKSARRQRLQRRCVCVRATGAKLPFRKRSFDAVIHTDVL